MLDTKKFETLLTAGQRKRADLDKNIARLRAKYDEATAAMTELQREQADLKRRLTAADKGDVVMTEAEIGAAADRLRYLTGAIERAKGPWSEADTALKRAENDARGVMQPLKNEAVRGYRLESFEAQEAYEKAWLML